jgi:hypothetical protein
MPKLKAELNVPTSGPNPTQTVFPKILHRRIKPCGAALVLFFACTVGSAIASFAQEERPQIMPGERKPKSKKDAGPRALGVLQMPANGKASLVPVAILINGKFWDAGAYKADPVPMALDYGTIYEAEHTGNSLGLFTVAGALRRNNTASGSLAPWIATGTWRPNGSEPDKKPAKIEAVPVGIDTSEGPPRLTRDTAAKDKPPDSTKPSTNSPAGSSAPSAPAAGGSSGSGDGPPRLTKPASSPDTPSSSAPGSGQSAPGGSPPADGKTDNKKASEPKAETKVAVPASDSGASEGNRPKLRRGKPAESFADEDVPGYSKVSAISTTTSDSSKAAVATQGDVQLIPAISDAGGPEIRSFVFQWLKGEEEDRLKQMTDFAKDQLRAHIAARAKATVTATTTRSPAARTPAKPKDPVLQNVHMVAYDVWLSNQPILILSAEGHMPPPPPGTAHSEVQAETQYSVLIVAYPDIYNNLHKLYVGITDKFHLDVTPRLELVDAVDADGDGRGELLFRQTSDQGTGWVIYRPTADKLWKMYDSLRPE